MLSLSLSPPLSPLPFLSLPSLPLIVFKNSKYSVKYKEPKATSGGDIEVAYQQRNPCFTSDR